MQQLAASQPLSFTFSHLADALIQNRPSCIFSLKGIVHLNMKILSYFTHPYVIPNLYDILWYILSYILKNIGNQTLLVPTEFQLYGQNQWEQKLFGSHC